MNCVWIDIDGTIADIEHRRHHVSNDNKRWKQFFDEMVNDPCIVPVASLAIAMHNQGFKIVFCSGRPDNYRAHTEHWLNDMVELPTYELHMRAAGDYRSDVIVKREILNDLRNQGYDFEFAVDDRQSVVDMLRSEGLVVLQAAPGDFDTKPPKYDPGVLHMLIGPSGAGKSYYFKQAAATGYCGIRGNMYVGSDDIRAQLCGDFQDQSKNFQVFNALHALVKARIDNGLSTVVDATNLKNRDRRAIRDLCPSNCRIIYHVVDRPLKDKMRDGGWRLQVFPRDGLTLVEVHDQVFRANLKDILSGDGDERVEVRDVRT